MMSRRQYSRHSSPTGARTNGGASTTNTITPQIYGLSILIRSLPLKLHMQKHHPTPNQKLQGPPSIFNPHHHTLPSLSKTPTQPCRHTTSNYTQIQTCSEVLGEYSTAAGLSTEATRKISGQYESTIGSKIWMPSLTFSEK